MSTQGSPLTTPYFLDSIDDSDITVIANRFPTPGMAHGFLTDVDTYEPSYDKLIPISGRGSFIAGALQTESMYLEPTVGQIWPR